MKKVISILLSALMIFTVFSFCISAAGSRQLDFVFVVDTTGSMEDDIDKVQTDMHKFVDDLKVVDNDYRVAIVDYRDFATRTDYSEDYPYAVQLDFSNNYDRIQDAIDSLTLGNGGDGPETVYSALVDGLDELSWRERAGKMAVLIGDAPALDPEPITGYTLETVAEKLGGRIPVEDDREYAPAALARSLMAARSPITVFAVATGYSAVDSFEKVAQATGGKSYTAFDSEEITAVIEEIITEEAQTIIDNQDPNMCHWCGNVHTGFFQGIIGFFHRILIRFFGEKY